MEAGSQPLAGVMAALTWGRVAVSEPGALNVGGEASQALHDRVWALEPDNVIAIAGADSETSVGRMLAPLPGAVEMLSGSAEFLSSFSPTLVAGAGAFNLTPALCGFVLEVQMQQTVPMSAAEKQEIATLAASAVVQALQTTTIPVNVTKVNSVTLRGTGNPKDPMRPA